MVALSFLLKEVIAKNTFKKEISILDFALVLRKASLPPRLQT